MYAVFFSQPIYDSRDGICGFYYRPEAGLPTYQTEGMAQRKAYELKQAEDWTTGCLYEVRHLVEGRWVPVMPTPGEWQDIEF